MSRTTSVTASYSLFDKTAATDGTMSMADQQPFSDVQELIAEEEQTLKPWATLEGEAFLLDGSLELMHDNMPAEFMGVWSAGMSGEDGVFSVPPVFLVTFSQAHTSAGITLTFAESTGDWCSGLTIEWYGQSGALLASGEYAPTAVRFFCEKQVEDFYKIRITFRRTNKPKHFLKLTKIQYGMMMELGGTSLISCSILEETDPLSAELSVNTLTLSFLAENGEFDLLDLTGAYILFQQRQRVDVTGVIDGVTTPMGAFYLDRPTVEENVVTLDCIDRVGTLGDTDFMGGYWPDGIAAGTLIGQIMASAGVEPKEYTVDPSLSAVAVQGYLPVCSHREALQQVAFAIGAVVSCARSELVQILPPKTDSPKVVPLSRKVVGHTQEQDSLVTGVEVYIHNYALSDSATELFRETRQPGTYTIQFSSPAASLAVSGASLLESGVNYARVKVTAAGTVTITGTTYEDTTSLAGSVYAESLPANAVRNVRTVEDCTLYADAQALAQRVYDWYQRRVTDVGQVILDGEQAGDWVALANRNGKILVGSAEQIDIDLTGGFIGKVVTRGTGQLDL